MLLESRDLGKKYTGRWVFRHLYLSVSTGDRFAITGNNGAGKSTLVQILAGMMFPSEGSIHFTSKGKQVQEEQIREHIAFAAPYLLLPEQFTGYEIAKHWFSLRAQRQGMDWMEIFETTALKKGLHQPLKSYSSGMKSRLKLGLALFTDASLVLLDEPTANMDQEGVHWYQQQLHKIPQDHTLIIASNNPEEYQICDQILNMNTL